MGLAGGWAPAHSSVTKGRHGSHKTAQGTWKIQWGGGEKKGGGGGGVKGGGYLRCWNAFAQVRTFPSAWPASDWKRHSGVTAQRQHRHPQVGEARTNRSGNRSRQARYPCGRVPLAGRPGFGGSVEPCNTIDGTPKTQRTLFGICLTTPWTASRRPRDELKPASCSHVAQHRACWSDSVTWWIFQDSCACELRHWVPSSREPGPRPV